MEPALQSRLVFAAADGSSGDDSRGSPVDLRLPPARRGEGRKTTLKRAATEASASAFAKYFAGGSGDGDGGGGAAAFIPRAAAAGRRRPSTTTSRATTAGRRWSFCGSVPNLRYRAIFW
jgi:hypothetical protein